MRFKLFLENEELIEQCNKKYPLAGRQVSGLDVNPRVDNTNSISASFNDYFILKGIREFPLSDFQTTEPHKLFYAANDFARLKSLALEISQSKTISPIIVAFDAKGPYILEGGHRVAALHTLKIQTVPAMIVIDLDE